MAYTTKEHLIERFGERELIQLTDRPARVAIDDAVLDRALNDGADEIDKYIGVVYALPLAAPYGGVLERINADISRYFLFDNKAPPEVRTRFEDAIANLRRIADGKATLGPNVAKLTETTGVSSGARVRSDAQVFTDAVLDRMTTDASGVS